MDTTFDIPHPAVSRRGFPSSPGWSGRRAPGRRPATTWSSWATVGALAVVGAARPPRRQLVEVVVAGGLAFVLTQLGFIGHDAGHRQICARRGHNDAIGLIVANLLTGFSFGWWFNKHNHHHAHTQRPRKDSTCQPGALVYTPNQPDRRGWFSGLGRRPRPSC